LTVGDEVLRRLRMQYRIQAEEYVSLYTHLQSRDPFRVLVATILSQNTTDKAALNALKTLERDVGLSPPAILGAGRRRVEKAIRMAGMYRSKSQCLLEASRIIVERYGGDMWNLLKGDAEEVRERLMELPGVGGKTADVLLTTMGIIHTVPVDTHVRRISTRLGLVDEGASYEMVRKRLEDVFSANSRHLAHLLLIAHGRRVCRARRPLCGDCVLNDLCKYYKEIRKN